MITWMVIFCVGTKEEHADLPFNRFMQDYIITEQIMREFNEPEELREKYFRLTQENTQYPFARFRIDHETYLQYYVYSVIHRYPPFAIALFERKDSLSYIFNFNDELSLSEGKAGSGNIEVRFNEMIDTLGFSRNDFMIVKLIKRVFGVMMGLKSYSKADMQVILRDLETRKTIPLEKFIAEVNDLPEVNGEDTFLFEAYQGGVGFWLIRIEPPSLSEIDFHVTFRFIGSSIYDILYV
jgi:hypothetical protein